MNRTASNYENARENIKNIRQLISAGIYDADIAKCIPGTLDLIYQEMTEEIETKEKAANFSYNNMEQLDFQIMLTVYVIPNSIHLCSPMKIKKSATRQAT